MHLDLVAILESLGAFDDHPFTGADAGNHLGLISGDRADAHRPALDAIVARTLELGGTITGEHGVGLAKKAWLRKQMGDDSYELMRQIKQTLDPAGLLNPGKIFD